MARIQASAALIAVLCASALSSKGAAAAGADLFAPSQEAGKAIDGARALPITSFYSEPMAALAYAPGTLVRAELATEYTLPAGVTATRILYHTRTASDQDALASGVVLVPYGKPPKNGWPLLAWSHGTSGVGRSCAPSLMKTLFYDWEGLYQYVMLGYAVVATDYAGLGTEGRHAYLDLWSNGADAVYSIPAARAAVQNLGSRWVAIGHSQGGLSTLGVAQIQADLEDPGFLGAVVLAGASDIADGIEAARRAKVPAVNGLLAFWVFGIKSVYRDFEPGEILTDKAVAIYNAAVEDGCSGASGSFAALAPDDVLKPGWDRNPYVRRFLQRNEPGARPIRGPLLLVGGGEDILFTEPAGGKVFRRLCRAGGRVARNVYPGLGHDPVVYGSLKDQMDWIANRFAGRPAPTDCASRALQ